MQVAATIQDKAQGALSGSPIHALRDLRVDSADGSLQITGRVDSFYHKQLAQEAVRAVAEGVRVVNHTNVEA